MVLEIGGGGSILRILKVPDASGLRFAHTGCTCEEMTEPSFMILNGHVIVEEGIDRGPPSPLQSGYGED